MVTDRVKVNGKKSKATPTAVTPRKSSRISEQVVKRKATEDVSPASTKKLKAVGNLATETAVAAPAKQKKAKVDKKEQQTPATLAKEKADPSEDKESDAEHETVAVEEDDTTKALVQEIDSGDDSDDETAGGASLFQPGQDVGKVPAAAVKKAAQIKAKAKAASGAVATNAPLQDGTEGAEAAGGEEFGGVVYVGRVPHGFFEHEMRSYFSQFGDIRRLRLSRNRKTGASKHYAFIEFTDREVADIVAKTMDNYLLFGHLLRCSVVATERIPPNLFKGANRRFKAVPWNRMAGRRLALPQSETGWTDKIGREAKRRADRAAKLESKLGYSFSGPTLKSVDTVEAAPAIEGKPQEEQKQLEPAADNGNTTAATPAAVAVPAIVADAAKGKKGKGKKSKA